MLKRFFYVVLAVAGCAVAAAGKPIMKVAVITDTHVKEKPQSAFLVGEAYKLFR